MEKINHDISYDDLEPIIDGLKALKEKATGKNKGLILEFIDAIMPEREFEVWFTVRGHITVAAKDEDEAREQAESSDTGDWEVDDFEVDDIDEA